MIINWTFLKSRKGKGCWKMPNKEFLDPQEDEKINKQAGTELCQASKLGARSQLSWANS